jgi:hypothetical protein
MPPYRNKRTRRKRTYRKKKTIGRPPSRALGAPRPYLFKRTISEVQSLSNENSYWTNSGANLGKAFAFSLASMAQETDFQHLFKYYRLKGARVRMYFSNTGSIATSETGTSTFPNSQIMVTIDRNMNGETGGVADETTYLQSQTAKRRIALGGDRRPIDIYMPLKQANEVYQSTLPGGGTISRNTLSSPKWIATENDDVPHFGFNLMFQRVDGTVFTSGFNNNQSVRILTTIYLECKKVE